MRKREWKYRGKNETNKKTIEEGVVEAIMMKLSEEIIKHQEQFENNPDKLFLDEIELLKKITRKKKIIKLNG